ncbi:hypothetical protein P8C59_008232 [Phyllachora maydis]|uniref:Integrase catalytic domain-containing protein n=1 Tax=Phyllachora maydis TaxID=1825666 RepID=A0AAD9MGK3_9PEZI|nr:hypothetical protein P8C59_008232 [Phyllachora maydis]
MHLLRRSCRIEADQAKGKGIAPKRASNPADPGQSSRPLPPIRTLLEDKEDGEDYSEVIEVLKQHIKSYKRVIASQSSNIKTLLLSLNTLKASIKDSVSAIKNISSTFASLTNSSNAAATGKTSYSPRFNPFSSTIDFDSPPHPPRKEPHLGPAIDNTATSNLDPPIDTGSKEGFKDTITSSIVKELSKKAYTILDDTKLSGESNFKHDSDQAVLLMLLRDSLSSSPRAAISRPIESKKEDVYNEFHALTFSTYRKGLSAFNAEFNGYLAKLTIAKIDIDPSLILNQYFKALKSKFPSWVSRQKSSIRQARMLGLTASSLNIEYLIADILEESRNPATEAYRAAHVANSSNSTPNSNSNPSKKGKNKKKGKKKASYNVKGQNYSAKSAEQASFILGSYNLAIEEEVESNSSSNSGSSSDSNTQLAQLLALKGYKKRKDFKGKGLKTSSNKVKYKDNQPRRRPRDPALYNKRPPPTYTKLVLDNVLYLPNIDINIISRVRHYNSGGCLIKENLYRGDRRCIAVLDFKKSGFFLNVKGSSKPILHANFAFPLGLSSYTTKSIEPQRNKIVVEIPSNSIRKEDYRPIIEDAIVSKAIEPNKRYKLRNSPAKGTTLEGIGPSLRGKRPCRPIDPLATAQAPYKSPRKTREPKPLTGTKDLPRVLREPVIEGNKVEKAISSPTSKEPNIGQRDYYNLLNLAKLGTEITDLLTTWLAKRGIKFSTAAPYIHKQNSLVERSCFILEAIVDLVNSTAITNKETTPFQALFNELEPGIPHIPNLERYRANGARGEAIIPLEKRSKSLKFTSRTEECKLLAPTNNTALEEELVDLDLDLEGAVSPDPSNLNTKKPINIEIGPSKLEPYESSSDSKLDKPSPDKPINPVIVKSTRPTISIRKPELPEAFPQTIEPILAPKPIEVIAPNQPITNEPLNNSDLISEGDKMQLDYYKLLAKTSSYILSFVYKARKRVISKDSTPTTYKQVLKLLRDERSKWLEAITKEFIQLLELGVFKFLPRSLLPFNRKLITCQNVLKVKKDAKNRPIKYKSRLVARGFIQVEGLDYTITYASTSIPPTWRILPAIASNKAIYKLLLKYGYNPSTPNIIKLSKALYGVFYNAKTCHFIVTYIDDCLFIGPNIGYITDLKKRLNKVYAIEDLGPTAYFLGVQIIRDRPNRRLWLNHQLQLEEDITSHLCNSMEIKLYQSLVGTAMYIMLLTRYLNSTKDYSIYFSYNGNTVANLGPKLSNSSNTTTKLSRDFHSKEGPRPLTTTSTTIVDFRNSKGSSRTSIINSSLVPKGFSDSDFTGDKATSKSTYGYLYKLAEAIREVQWIIGLFSELHRPIDYPITLYRDNQGSITVANDPALYARTKHTLLKFRYVREQVKAKIVTIIYLNTKYMPADGLTKALPVRQSSRPLPPIRTLLEDKEDGEDYSEVIEVLKQHIKSYKRVIASQSSNIKTLLLSLNTLKASIKDSVSAIKNISSTFASLTNSSNAAATRKTSYSPRFNPFSSTIDFDSPPHPPRKEPHLGPAIDNTATSNLDPPIDTGSKEGFKDTITSSIVKELSKKAYTILDDTKLSGESNFKHDSDQAVLLMLLRDSLSSSPRAAISRPIESKKEDVYNEFHALTFSTYRKGLSAFNAEFNGYLAKLTIAKIDIDPSLILNQYFKALKSKFPSWVSRQKSSIRQARMLGLTASSLNIEYLIADILEESRNPATEAYRAAHVANSSNSTPNSNSNPSKKGKNKKKGKKKASYNVKGQNYSAKSAEQASFILGSYNLAIEEEVESNSSSNSGSSSDSNTQLAQLLALKGYKKRKDFKGKGLKTSSNKVKYKDNQPRRRPRDPALYNSQLRPINTGNSPISPAGIGSITLEVLSRKAPPTYTKLVLDNVLYLPNIDINIISRVRHYNSGGCLIKENLYRGDRRCIAVLDFKKSGFFLNVKGSSKPILHANFAFPLGLSSYTTKSIEPQRNKIVVEIPSNSIRKEDYRPIIEDAIVSKAIEPNKRYKLRNSPAKGTTLEGIGPSLRGKRPRRPIDPLATAQAPYKSPRKTREPKPLTGTKDLPRVLREPVIEGNKVEKAISSPTSKEPNIGQRDYYNLLNLAKFITKGLPNFDKIKEADFHCSSYNRGKAVRRVSKALIPDLPRVLDSIEGDTVKIRPRPYNRNPIVLLLVDRKSRYRWGFNLPNKSGPIVANAIKGFFRGLRNGFGRYPTQFHFDRGTEITDLLTTWLAKRGIKFSTAAPYIHKQNSLVERSCFILEAIVDLVNSIAITNKETTPFQALFNELEPGIPHIPNLERYRANGARGEAIIPLEKRSKSLKFTSRTEECKLLAPTNNTALEEELVDLDLDLEGAVSPDPSNLNTKKPINIEIGPSKLEPYESSSDSKLDKPSPDKPINPVIVKSTRPTISIRKPELPEAFPQTIEPILAPKPIEVIAPNQPITNEPLNNSDLISEGDKMQLDYYKLLAKTSSYILDERSKWLEAITKEFIQLLELGVFKFLPRSLLPSNCKLITCQNVLKVKKDAKNRPIKYKSRLVARGFIQVEGLDYTITYASTSIPPTWRILLAIASNKAIYKLLLKYGYNPSTPNIIKLSKALYGLKQSPREWQDKLKILLKSLGYLPLISDPGVFYNAKTCHFIVTYIDDCLFIGPNIGYITDLKKRLNKVYAIEDLGPTAYFLGLSRSLNRPTKSHLNAAKNLFKYLNSTKDYSIYFSYNGNTVANLGPKLSNSSNITTKLSKDFHSKEGPRPLTTTSTTIVDFRNSKGSSRTSIINSSLVPKGFSDSDFTGDKATSKSTYGYLYKLAEAIREVQWIIGLFSELHRPIDYPITLYRDNQGSITVANDPALYARTKHTLLKFRYVREQVKAKIVTIIYLNTKYMPADGLTKALPVINSTGYFTAL